MYRLLKSGLLVHNADYTRLVNSVKGLLWAYPAMVDPRTSRLIPFPSSIFKRTGPAQPFGNTERGVFIREWIDRGFPVPPGGWGSVEIHHIHPQEWGGSNDFWNLIPLPPSTHGFFNRFWDVVRRGGDDF